MLYFFNQCFDCSNPQLPPRSTLHSVEVFALHRPLLVLHSGTPDAPRPPLTRTRNTVPHTSLNDTNQLNISIHPHPQPSYHPYKHMHERKLSNVAAQSPRYRYFPPPSDAMPCHAMPPIPSQLHSSNPNLVQTDQTSRARAPRPCNKTRALPYANLAKHPSLKQKEAAKRSRAPTSAGSARPRTPDHPPQSDIVSYLGAGTTVHLACVTTMVLAGTPNVRKVDSRRSVESQIKGSYL